MAGLIDSVIKSVDTNVTDIFNHTNSVVARDIYALNADLFEGFQWISCLDSVTCLVCAGLDNQIFDLLPDQEGTGTKAPEQPLHGNCRCYMVPVTEGMKQENLKGPNYEEWFERQPKNIKLEILGPARYRAYEETGITIREFTKDLQVRTLEELGIQRTTRKAEREREIEEEKTDPIKYEPEKLADYFYNAISEGNRSSHGINTKIKDKLLKDLKEVPIEIRKAIRETNADIIYFDKDFKYKGQTISGSLYNSGENKLFLSAHDNWRITNVLLHEEGHAIDYKHGKVSAKMDAIMRNDFNNWIENVKKKGLPKEMTDPVRLKGYAIPELKTKADILTFMSKPFFTDEKESYVTHLLLDVIQGIDKKTYGNHWYHSKKYWDIFSPSIELWAHFNSADSIANGSKLFGTVFKNSYKYYKDFMRETYNK